MVDESNPVISRFTNRIKGLINNKADKTNATQSNAGLMSAEDKIKLDAIDTQYSINVEKQSTAEYGFFSTYVIKQNNTQKGVKINIPKDFLVKSATVKTCTIANSPVSGYEVGDKYIDLVINSKDSTDTDEHLYLATKEIGAYPVDEVTLTVDNGKLAIKDNGITWAKLSTVVRGIINGKEDINNKVNSVSASSTITQYPSAKCVYDTFCQGNDPRLSDSRSPKFIDINASSTSPKDLDDYTTGGFYYCDMGTETPYISNCPKTGTNNTAFFLLVEAWNSNNYSVKQTLTYYNNQKTYVRTKVNTNWSSWNLIQTTNSYIPSTHTSPTSDWTGTSDEIVKLIGGTVIYYYLKRESTTSPVTLNLTLANGDTTGAKNVYFDGTTRLSNQYRNNSMICLYYSGNDWFVVNPYKFDISTNHQGGTNLLQGTQNFNGVKGILQRYEIGFYRDLRYVLVNNTNETSYSDLFFAIPANTFNYGEKYTLSFWASGSGHIAVYNYGNTNYVKAKVINCTNGGTSTNTTTYNDGNCAFKLDNTGWKRYFITWELNPTSNSSNDLNVDKMIILRTMAGATAKFAGVMYERGEIPHDWSPSPLDNSLFDYSYIKGTDNTVGYIKALRLQIGSVYQDKPISIEIYQRNRKTKNIINIGFQNANGIDPGVNTGFFSYYGDEDFKAYLYKESASVWSLITSKAHANKYGEMLVKISNPNPGIYISKLDTHIASLPSNTTSNPLYTASCLEKTTPFTVTYTDGTTSTVNFVTR